MRTLPLKTEDVLSEASLEFRSHVGKISRQTSVFFAGTIFTAAAGYFFKVYVARMLGAEALGIYALGMTATGLAGVFAALGLPQSASRFVAAYFATNKVQELRGFLWRSTGILALSYVLVGAILIAGRGFIAQRFYHVPEIAPNMSLFVCLMLVGAFTSFFGQVLAGYKDVTQRTIITNFVGTPLLMLSVVVLLTLGFGLRGYLVGQFISASIVLAMLFVAVLRLSPRAVRFPFGSSLAPLGSEVIAYSKTLLGVQALEFLLTQTDRIALGLFVSVRLVGVYSLAVSLTSFVSIVLQSVNQIFSPTIAELHAKGNGELLLRLYQTLTKWTLGLTIPLAFSLMIFASPLMEVFGPAFRVGWPVLVIVSAGQLINCGVGSVGFLLFMTDQQSKALRIQSFLSPVVVALTFAMIGIWGSIGAAVVGAFTNAITNLLYLREAKKSLGIFPSIRGYSHLFVPSFATLSTILILRLVTTGMRPQLAAIFLSLLLGYCVFFLAVALGKTTADDKLIFRGLWAFVRQSIPDKTLSQQFARIFDMSPPLVTAKLGSGGAKQETNLMRASFQFMRPDQLEEDVFQEIADFLDSEDTSHPFQHPQWTRLEAAEFSVGTRFCIYRENHRIKWFALCGTLYPSGRIAFPFRALVSTRGPVCGDAAVSRAALYALAQRARSEGFIFIEVSPELIPEKSPTLIDAFKQNSWEPEVGNRTSLRLDLTKTEDELIVGFRQTTRHEVRNAERIGIIVEKPQRSAEISEFLNIYSEMAVRKGFSADPIHHLRSIIHWLSDEPHRGALLLAKHKSNILGGVVIVRSGRRCWYVWGATQKHEYASTGHLLQWRAIQWAKSQGCAEYDFGGYTENATSGPALFKKGFGGEVVHFTLPQRIVVNKPKNQIMRFLARFQRF